MSIKVKCYELVFFRYESLPHMVANETTGDSNWMLVLTSPTALHPLRIMEYGITELKVYCSLTYKAIHLSILPPPRLKRKGSGNLHAYKMFQQTTVDNIAPNYLLHHNRTQL